MDRDYEDGEGGRGLGLLSQLSRKGNADVEVQSFVWMNRVGPWWREFSF